jgi:hypothetical protein
MFGLWADEIKPPTIASASTVDYTAAARQATEQAMRGTGQADLTAEQQRALADMLMAAARGEGPSVAQAQLQRGQEEAAALAAASTASTRGLNRGLAARIIGQQQASTAQQMAGQAAELRAREQQAAQQLAAGALGTQRSQDIGQQQANAALLGTVAGAQQGTAAIQAQQEAQRAQAELDAQRAETERVRSNQELVGSTLSAFAPAITGKASGAGKARGGRIVGGTPAVDGDSMLNDTVPAMLSPGEVVLPREVVNAPDGPARAARFVRATMADSPETMARGLASRAPREPDLAELLRFQRELEAMRAATEADISQIIDSGSRMCGGAVRGARR